MTVRLQSRSELASVSERQDVLSAPPLLTLLRHVGTEPQLIHHKGRTFGTGRRVEVASRRVEGFVCGTFRPFVRR